MNFLTIILAIVLLPVFGTCQIKKVYQFPSYDEFSDPDVSVFANEKKDTVHIVRLNKPEARGNYYWFRSFYEQSNLWEKALAEYTDALRIHEITEEACDDCHELLSLINFRIGVCLYNLGQYAKGVHYLTKSINLIKNGHFFSIRYASQLKNPNATSTDMSSYFVSPSEVLFTEDHAMIFMYRALAKMKLEDYYGAEKDIKEGIKLGERPGFYTIYGQLLTKMKRYQEALTIFNKVISTDKNNGIAYYYRGIIKLNIKDKLGGCQDLSKAGELGVEDAYRIIKENCNK